jgi:hypothetical protein
MSTKKAAGYCEAVVAEFAWFDARCMATATAKTVIDGDEYGMCYEHTPTPTKEPADV